MSWGLLLHEWVPECMHVVSRPPQILQISELPCVGGTTVTSESGRDCERVVLPHCSDSRRSRVHVRLGDCDAGLWPSVYVCLCGGGMYVSRVTWF